MTQYILQKDLPNLKAGAIFEWGKIDNCYTALYTSGSGIKDFKMNNFSYTKEEVENNTEWFLPVGNLTGSPKEYWMEYGGKELVELPRYEKKIIDIGKLKRVTVEKDIVCFYSDKGEFRCTVSDIENMFLTFLQKK